MLRELDEAARALVAPRVVLFDWHATLVDTLDAMYHAVDDVLPRLPELGLVDYVREHRQLHPKIKAERRISRTDIFEVLFGDDEDAKHVAHDAFNAAYRNHYGDVQPLEGGELDLLIEMHAFEVKLGILTNRDREFFEREFAIVDGGAWLDLFDTTVCGDDTGRRKPSPDPILKALANLGEPPAPNCWYVGDSTTDVIAAKRAGIKIFPGTAAHPYQPDSIVDDFTEFKWLVEECLEVGHDWPAVR